MSKRRHRLSGRLLLLFVITAVLLATIVRVGFRFAIDRNMGDMAAPHLAEYVHHLLNELGDPPSPERAAQLAARLPIQIHLLGSTNWSSGGAMPTIGRHHVRSQQLSDGTRIQVGRGPGGFAVSAYRDDVTVIFAPKGFELADSAPLAAVLTIAALLTVLAFAYHAIRRLFHPIETIQTGVARIGSGHLEDRLDIGRRDELGGLATSINAMADDIQHMLDAKRELLLAVSHELRSPLTRARVNTALLDPSDTRSALLADLDALGTLLGELLESERLSGRHVALDRQAVDPTVLLHELIDESFATGGLRLDLDPEGTWLSLDATRIRLLVRNLLKNALSRTPVDEPAPLLTSHVDDECWRFAVTDHGIGVAPEHVGRLTEPFYRADPSRQRSSGGVGLGLYLSRVIAEAHGGTLSLISTQGKGTRVEVKLPVSGEF